MISDLKKKYLKITLLNNLNLSKMCFLNKLILKFCGYSFITKTDKTKKKN